MSKLTGIWIVKVCKGKTHIIVISYIFLGFLIKRGISYYRAVFKTRSACPDFDQILVRFSARFLTRVLARCFGVENTVYSSTGTEKYSFTGSEEKVEKNID